MPRVKILKSSAIKQSSRLVVLRSLTDYPDEEETEFRADVDIEFPEQWDIGLIVGPSGSGKTSLAVELFGAQPSVNWDRDKAVFDHFPQGPSETASLLSSVGLSSVPAWLRPRHVLSGGEGFRADVARVLADQPAIAVIDEFTSVVDRTVAKAISVSVAKHARRVRNRLVCVGCHYDILDWLQPDWVVDMADCRYYRRSLQRRPTIQADVGEVSALKAWRAFEPHHYMRGSLPPNARAWCAFIDGAAVGFCSYAKLPHAKVKNMVMGARHVVLPDYQGFGIGRALINYVSGILHKENQRVRNRTAHPGAQRIFETDKDWVYCGAGRTSTGSIKSTIHRGLSQKLLCHRVTRAYEYRPKPADD